MKYSESKQKELETRKRLGPRIGRPTVKSTIPPDFYGAVAKRHVSRAGNRKSHPSLDSPS